MTTETVEPKTENGVVTYQVRDANGDFHTIQRTVCKVCNKVIYDTREHKQCHREIAEELAFQAEKQRQEECMAMFGEILPRTEQLARTYPNDIVEGYSESYNKRLARMDEEKRLEHIRILNARRDRREIKLPAAIRNLQSLQAQVRIDQEEEAAEEKAKEKQKE